KSSLVFACKHEPGSLMNCLDVFRDYKLNLSKLESRPIPERSWQYRFLLDFDHNQPADVIERALKELKERALEFQLLGSYDLVPDH
ncbi:MAG: hypothetical protein KDD53_10810, partial [Bdellovibrionales bacterium]|nr:hypothetical protein [Bdellovibrionales bacterium]